MVWKTKTQITRRGIGIKKKKTFLSLIGLRDDGRDKAKFN